MTLLADAAAYPGVDDSAVDSLRLQIAENSAENRFLTRLAAADAQIDAGRLLTPAGDNARSSLAALKIDHEDDPRLVASLNRLGERLLTLAGVATATENFSEAEPLLEAAGTLGVMSEQVGVARLALQRAMAQSSAAAAAVAETAETVSPGPQESGAATRVPADRQTAVDESAAAGAGSAPSTADAGNAPGSSAGEAAGPAAAAPSTVRKITSLTDLGIQKYVAPRYPRSARRRELQGFVEVRFTVNTDGSTSAIRTVRSEPGNTFDSSAERAVSQWRFAPRDNDLTTQITLSFALEP